MIKQNGLLLRRNSVQSNYIIYNRDVIFIGLFNGYNFDHNSATKSTNASLLKSGVSSQPAQSPLVSTSNNSNSNYNASQSGNVVYNHTTQSLSSLSLEKLE